MSHREILELAKLQAEVDKLKYEAEREQAEARLAIAEAVEKEQDAMIAGIRRRGEELTEQLAKVSDFQSFVYHFDGQVDQRSTVSCLNVINSWHRLYPDCPMNLVINSPGGDVVAGMQLFDQITAYSKRGGGNHYVTMTVRGYAASMAGVLLQAADHRVCGAESYILIHEGSVGAVGSVAEVRDTVDWVNKMSERIADIFVRRSGGKTSLKQYHNGCDRKDWWLDSTEALKRGFVDAIG